MSTRWVLPKNGDWVGPPPLLTPRGELIDGKRRVKEAKDRGFKVAPPLRTNTHLEVVAHLTAAGHQLRAADYAMLHAAHLATATITQLEKLTGIAQQRWVPFVSKLRGTNVHKRRRRAIYVVQRGLTLAQKMREGYQPSIRDLEEMLGEFLNG